jgi:LysR family transcriptional regulator for metE and metH
MHPQFGQDPIEEHFILYCGADGEGAVLRAVFRAAGGEPARVSTIRLTEGILEMVKAGLGVSVMTRWAVAPHAAAGALRTVRLTPRGLQRRWSAVTLRQQRIPAHLGEFIRLLAQGPRPLGEPDGKAELRLGGALTA